MAVKSLNLVQKGLLGNILFTGKGTALIDSIIDHIGWDYSIGICPSIDVEIDCCVEEFSPSAVVVCLMNETSDAMKSYSVLSSKPQYINIPVFVVGKEEECDIFKKNVFSNQIEIFKRPLESERFYSRLSQIVEKAAVAIKPKAVEEVEVVEDEMEDKNKVTEDENKVFAVEKSLMDKIKRMTVVGGKKIILVVDDDVRMLNIIKLYLQDIYEVVVVPSGTLALKYLAKKKADVVLLDYMMPEMDGPTVLKEIREKSSCPNIPVVFLTGVSDKDMVIRCIELRPNGYLLKPVSRETLLEKITEVALGL